MSAQVNVLWEWRGRVIGTRSGVYVDIEALVSVADGAFLGKDTDALVVVPTEHGGHRSVTAEERELALETALGVAARQLAAARGQK